LRLIIELFSARKHLVAIKNPPLLIGRTQGVKEGDLLGWEKLIDTNLSKKTQVLMEQNNLVIFF
jgi:hypothetical protein